MSVLDNQRPAEGANHLRDTEGVRQHMRKSNRHLAPWIVAAAAHGSRRQDAKAAKQRRTHRRAYDRKPCWQKSVVEVGDEVWYSKMAERTRLDAAEQAAAEASLRKEQAKAQATADRRQSTAQEAALSAIYEKICGLYSAPPPPRPGSPHRSARDRSARPETHTPSRSSRSTPSRDPAGGRQTAYA